MEIKIYEVGGSIRDSILGIPNKDRDFCVIGPSYEVMREYLIERGAKIYLEKPEYFAIRCKLPGIGDADFVLGRTEGYYLDGRRPDKVKICDSIEEEMARRDFTSGAVAKDEAGNLIDPFGGIKDIQSRVLRCVGDTYARFEEDHLRIVRAIRFFITKGFDLHPDIRVALRDELLVIKLIKISRERIYEELRKCFAHDTKKTLDFFREYRYIEKVIFEDCGIKLEPKI